MKAYHPALFDGECLRRLELCTVYYTARAWDAWNSHETSRHKGAVSLSSSLEAAKEIAQGWPLPASYFVIHQLPALVLVGESSLAVVLADAHTNPFAGWHPSSFDVLRTGTAISLLLRAFASRRTWVGDPLPDTLVTGMPNPAQGPREPRFVPHHVVILVGPRREPAGLDFRVPEAFRGCGAEYPGHVPRPQRRGQDSGLAN